MMNSSAADDIPPPLEVVLPGSLNNSYLSELDLQDTLSKAQNLLSQLTISNQNQQRRTTDSKIGDLNVAPQLSTESSELERQQRVEHSLQRRIISLKRNLVEYGQSHGVRYITYGGEQYLKAIMDLITKDLSEPYSIYTYRYFIYQWPKLCHLALDENTNVIGAIVCKMENSKGPLGRHDIVRRGYIAMLAVDQSQRRKKIGTALVASAVESLMAHNCDEVVLETETTNQAALKLYENLGFARHKRLLKYYLNGVDAFRLKLWLKYPSVVRERVRMSVLENLPDLTKPKD